MRRFHNIARLTLALSVASSACDVARGREPAAQFATDLKASRTESFRLPDGSNARVTARIGSLKGRTDAFGRIGDVLDLGEEGIVVLDEQALTLSWYDRSGQRRAILHASGEGPGRFGHPTSVVAFRGIIVLTDGVYPKWSEYRLHDDEITLLREVSIPFPLDAACVLGDTLFGTSVQPTGLVHTFDSQGRLQSSFGERLPMEPHEIQFAEPYARLIDQQRHMVEVGCDAAGSVIVALDKELPFVRAFSHAGRELWRTRLEDFRGMRRSVGPNGRGVRNVGDPGSGTYHSGEAVTLDSYRVLVTLLETGLVQGARGGEVVSVPELRFLSIDTGAELGRIRPFPVTLTNAGVGGSAGFSNDSVPRVLVYDGSPELSSELEHGPGSEAR